MSMHALQIYNKKMQLLIFGSMKGNLVF